MHYPPSSKGALASAFPPDFLAGPAPPTLTCTRVDFAQTPLPEYEHCYAVILDDVFTAEECAALVALAEAHAGDAGWERAMINAGGGRQVLATDVRNCGRIIWDDRELVARIFSRIAPHVPEVGALEGTPWGRALGLGAVKRGERWEFTRLNERMRFLKYTGGEYFKPHCDGIYETPDRSECSLMTLHLYLNDSSTTPRGDVPLAGGATTFLSYAGAPFKRKREEPALLDVIPKIGRVLLGGATNLLSYAGATFDGKTEEPARLDVMPKIGRVLLFQHRDLLHAGDEVVRGTKFTLRTDLMYKLVRGDET